MRSETSKESNEMWFSEIQTRNILFPYRWLLCCFSRFWHSKIRFYSFTHRRRSLFPQNVAWKWFNCSSQNIWIRASRYPVFRSTRLRYFNKLKSHLAVALVFRLISSKRAPHRHYPFRQLLRNTSLNDANFIPLNLLRQTASLARSPSLTSKMHLLTT